MHKFALTWWLAAVPLAAHDPGLSSLRITLDAPRLTADLTWSGVDFAATIGRPFDRDGDGRVRANELDVDALRPLARTWLTVRSDQQPVTWSTIDARVLPDGDVVITFTTTNSAAQAITACVPALAAMTHGHRQFATLVRNGRDAGEALLSAQAAQVTWNATASPPSQHEVAGIAAGTVGSAEFIALGLEHVLTGYDHLLFLLALLLSVASFSQALKVVTAFTVSHSLTLALAALDIARLPSTLVECAIAASVALVAAENLIGKRPARARWAFAFGLLHGFGFASCLSELQIGRGLAAVRPLLGFNVGVELGQLALVALVLPLLLLLRRRSARGAGRLSVVLSGAVLLCGLLWFVQRLP